MIKTFEGQEYEYLDQGDFGLKFFNPSPGNPFASYINFYDDEHVFVTWSDNTMTYTEIDKVEYQKEDDLVVAVVLWFKDRSIVVNLDAS